MVNMEYTLIKQDFSHLFMFECVRESGRQRGGGVGNVGHCLQYAQMPVFCIYPYHSICIKVYDVIMNTI